jgi:hypothetical protein
MRRLQFRRGCRLAPRPNWLRKEGNADRGRQRAAQAEACATKTRSSGADGRAQEKDTRQTRGPQGVARRGILVSGLGGEGFAGDGLAVEEDGDDGVVGVSGFERGFSEQEQVSGFAGCDGA